MEDTEKKISPVYIPPSFLLQWHITDICNLHCQHCYQENINSVELSYIQKLEIYQHFVDLVNTWQKLKNNSIKKIPKHITITGGEPFLAANFWELLEIFHSNKEITFAILTNGTLIDDAAAKKLAKLAPSFVQVSIEGTQQTHDKIRGEGNFVKAVSGLKNLRKYGLKTMISFTAHRQNYREFEDVARLGYSLQVSRVWADRLIPFGNAQAMQELTLTPKETQEFFQIMARSKEEISSHWWNKTEIAMNRALQFLEGGWPYHCHAGNDLITILPNGDVLPCRRMPIVVGNIFSEKKVVETNPLSQIYYHSELLQKLRCHKISELCKDCIYRHVCQSGLKCLAYTIKGSPWAGDPGCWRI